MTRKDADMIADVIRTSTITQQDREQITRDFLYRLSNREANFDRARFASIAMDGCGPGAIERVT